MKNVFPGTENIVVSYPSLQWTLYSHFCTHHALLMNHFSNFRWKWSPWPIHTWASQSPVCYRDETYPARGYRSLPHYLVRFKFVFLLYASTLYFTAVSGLHRCICSPPSLAMLWKYCFTLPKSFQVNLKWMYCTVTDRKANQYHMPPVCRQLRSKWIQTILPRSEDFNIPRDCYLGRYLRDKVQNGGKWSFG